MMRCVSQIMKHDGYNRIKAFLVSGNSRVTQTHTFPLPFWNECRAASEPNLPPAPQRNVLIMIIVYLGSSDWNSLYQMGTEGSIGIPLLFFRSSSFQFCLKTLLYSLPLLTSGDCFFTRLTENVKKRVLRVYFLEFNPYQNKSQT